MNKQNKVNPWAWISTLYFTEGLPYVLVMTVSVIMYKKLDISNTEIALYTSWLYLPWVIKPFWSPFIDLVKTKRWWIVSMQFLIGAGLGGVAFLIPTSFFFQATLAVFWLMAFSSATHDIAADGFYMLGLDEHEQSFFVGIRTTFYRLASIMGQGILIMLAGYLETKTGNIPYAWSLTFFVLAGLMIALSVYHKFILPYPKTDVTQKDKFSFTEFFDVFVDFFKKKNISIALLFILLYRLGEAQLVKIASPFLLDSAEAGGMGLTTSQVGFVYGTIGVVCLTVGGILGGIVISKQGIGKWLWPMVFAINLPDLVYVYLSFVHPNDFWVTCAAVGIEQLGYGFGFTAYVLFMLYLSQGKHQTSHYAICTGFMALGMMLPGMISGWIQDHIGYQNFFVWVCLCTIPGFMLIRFLKIDKDFGKK